MRLNLTIGTGAAAMLMLISAGCEKLAVPAQDPQTNTAQTAQTEETTEVTMVNTNQPSDNPAQTAGSDTAEQAGDYPTATFGAGCFWGVEYAFSQVPGVKATRVGFMGGHVDNPSYRRVCMGDTNHAEVVQLRYDPKQVSYETLVRFFFLSHDPTTLNRQGPDVGTQYRSAIFYHTPEQKQIAEKVKAEYSASGRFKRLIVTEITPAAAFWKAEDYHQDYARKNPGSCHIVNVKAVLSEIANE